MAEAEEGSAPRVIGGGAWGTALAAILARRRAGPVRIWVREPEVARAINRSRENSVFLKGVKLPENLRATTELAEITGAGETAHTFLLVVPAQHLRRIAARLAAQIGAQAVLVICAKGIEQSSALLMSEVLAQSAPGARLAVLSGPSFADEVAAGLPAALTLACPDPELGAQLCAQLAGPPLRLYPSRDLIGAQLGGAVKNVLALACGIAEGRQLGENARAGLITLGFTELMRLGLAMGAKRETLTGPAGLGDVILTCTSRASRNTALGIRLGGGESLDRILAAQTSVSEGVHSTAALVRLAKKHGVEMPVVFAVDHILRGRSSINQAFAPLFTRPAARSEPAAGPATEPE